MNLVKKSLTFGLIAGTRGIFNPKLADEVRGQLLEKLDSLGYSCVILLENETVYGAVDTLADTRKCAELFKQNRGL